jgi:hypothetical protein
MLSAHSHCLQILSLLPAVAAAFVLCLTRYV